MSLFKLKPLVTKAYPDQEFDEKHLAIGTIDQQPALALANFQGIFRLLLITKNKEVELQGAYHNKFQSPIVAVQFVSHPNQTIRGNTVGLLFFKKFAFISFKAAGQSFQANILNVETDPAFGICVSPLSVMTLNSTVQNLNPRQVYKIKVADPIYPFTSQMSKLFLMDGEELIELEGDNQQWRIILGRVRQLFVMNQTVIAIGERALWQIQHGKIIKTKVMEDQVSCGAISLCTGSRFNILVANFSGQLFVYSSNYELLWAVKLEYVPIKVIVSQHHSLRGMLVLLSDQGCLQLAYSGVEVPDSVIEPVSQKTDIDVVQAETNDYLSRIASKEPEKEVKKSEERTQVKGGYRLYFTEMQKVIQNHEQKQKLYQIEGRLIKVQLICEITSYQTLRNMKIQLNVPQNIYCKQYSKDLKVAKSKERLVFDLYANNERFPYERQLSVMVRYDNNDLKGAPFVNSQMVAIPMPLQCQVVGFETKESFANKIIVKSNTELPSFNELFPELIQRGSQEQRKSIKFGLANGVECVVAYNKGFNKAKVESEYYSGLCFVVNEFSNRIREHNKKTGSKIQLSVEIPLEQFFGIMKQHYEYRNTLKKSFQEVETKSQQFRNTQKKLLLKMKEKMTSIGNIDKLLQFNYDRLMESAGKYEEVTQKMDVINHNLSVAIRFIIELLFIRSNPSQKAKDIAWGILGYQKQSLERGWESKVLANSSHFLNKKFNKGDQVSFEQLQKIPLYVISKINNGDWN